MTIYHVDAYDPMNSSTSNYRISLGYFLKWFDANKKRDEYNSKLKNPKGILRAEVTSIEVQ